MCPPVSPCQGASIVKSSCMIRDAQIYFGMETPLRGRSGGHTGTAPTILNEEWYCRNVAEIAVGYGRIARGWMMPFNGMVQKGMMEIGRGGACVPARVALQGRIHRSSPAHNAYVFGMETPLRGRSGGHTGTAPTIPNTYRRSAKVKTRVLMLA